VTKIDKDLAQLPNGWIWTTLEEASSKLKAGGTPSTRIKEYYANGTIPFVKIEDFTRSKKYLFNTATKITPSGLKNSAAWVVPKDSILYSMYASYGEVVINKIEVATSQAIIAYIPINGLILNYFYYYLKKIQKELITRGTTQKNLNAQIVRSIHIPLPPLNEQRRIVGKVEELFSFLDVGTESIRKVRTQLKRYRQAVLKYAFEGKLTEDWRRAHKDLIESAQKALEMASLQFSKKQNTRIKPEISNEISVLPDGWVHARLENFIYIAGRIGWRGLKADEYTKDGPLFLSVHNLNKGNIVDLSETYHVSEERYSESPEIQLRNDDILLAKDGAGIGKIGIVKGLTVKATVNSSLLVIRSGCAFKPKFLFYFFKGPRMQELVKSRITGSATPHLFQRDIRKFDLLIPPLLEQEQIASQWWIKLKTSQGRVLSRLDIYVKPS
jgi:type I restriction enzyme S subunit